MQDEYVGDIGDYLKYAFLRALVGPDDAAGARSLGVNWYRTLREEVGNGGGYTHYLDEPIVWASLDPDVYEAMGPLARGAEDRSVRAVEQAPFWPKGTRFFGEPLSLAGLGPRDRKARTNRRATWHQNGLDATVGCDLVFLDPDIGIGRGGFLGAKGPKYVSGAEAADYVQRGQTIVLYAHSGRMDTPESLARRAFSLLPGTDDRSVDGFAVVFVGRGGRGFHVVGPAREVAILRRRAQTFAARHRIGMGRWSVIERAEVL